MNPTVAIIIADDLKFNRFAIRRQLDTIQLPIYEASNGRQVLELLQVVSEKNIILCLDIEMPIMDGLVLMQRIYDNPADKQIKVIITSSNDYYTYQDQLQQHDILGFIDKPVEKSVLLGYIENALSKFPHPS